VPAPVVDPLRDGGILSEKPTTFEASCNLAKVRPQTVSEASGDGEANGAPGDQDQATRVSAPPEEVLRSAGGPRRCRVQRDPRRGFSEEQKQAGSDPATVSTVAVAFDDMEPVGAPGDQDQAARADAPLKGILRLEGDARRWVAKRDPRQGSSEQRWRSEADQRKRKRVTFDSVIQKEQPLLAPFLPKSVGSQPRERFKGCVAAEVWAGVGSLSHQLEQEGLLTGAFCECLPREASLLRHKYPEALQSLDYDLGAWKVWPEELAKKSLQLVALVGGPVCASLSTGGKRLEQEDDRARQFVDTIALAVFLGVSFLVIENVLQLVNRDSHHGLYTRFLTAAKKGGFEVALVLQLCDAEHGGRTQRERVIVFLRKIEVHALLPPLKAPKKPGYQGQALEELLSPIEDLPADVWIDGDFVSVDSEKPSGKAWLMGHIRTQPSSIHDAKLGDECTLRGEQGWWVIKARDGDNITAFNNTYRSAPAYRWVNAKDVHQVRGRQLQVFDVRSVAITLRSFSLPPDFWMAIWDPRKPGVRALTGLEVWRLTELPERDAQWLLSQGIPVSYLGKMAGKSIPRSLAQVAAKTLCGQIELWREATLLGDSWKVPMVHSEVEPKLVLVIVSFHDTTPRFLMPPGDWLIGCRLGQDKVNQGSLVDTATAWAAIVLNDKHVICEIAVDARGQDHNTTSVMALVRDLGRKDWRPLQSLSGTKAVLAREVAVKAACVSQGWLHQSVDVLRTGRFGAVPVRLVKPRPKWDMGASDLSHREWDQLLINDGKAITELKRQLQHAATVTGLVELAEWGDTAALQDTNEIPPGVRNALRKLDQKVWKEALFPRRCEYPPLTTRLPRPAAQPHRRRYVKGVHECFRPDVWEATHAWIEKAMVNVDSDDPMLNEPWVVGPSGFVDWMNAPFDRWDCRKVLTHGYMETTDTEADIETHLNRALIHQEFASWPDQECVGFICEGVQYKADVGWQFVLCHHMVSFRATADKVGAEFQSHCEKGWFTKFSFPPFIPMRAVRRGSVERKNGGRPRPTMNSSWPHDKDTRDSDGFVVESINEASGTKSTVSGDELRDSRSYQPGIGAYIEVPTGEEPKEVKPTAGCVMAMLLVLVASANFLGEPVFIITDDAANYFNQFALAPSEYWKFVTILKDATTGAAIFMAEHCMGFGTRPSSNVAQRVAYMIVDLVKRRFSAEEEVLFCTSTDPKIREWYRERTKLSARFNEAMLFFMLMYTDDPIIAVVGIERTVRFLVCWVRTMKELNLMMALACKRQLGSGVVWCGIMVFARGALVVPLEKRVKALEKIRRLGRGELAVGDLVSLNGLLEFCRGVLRLPQQVMFGLYEPLKAGRELSKGPHQRVKLNALVGQRIKQWTDLLTKACANTVAAIMDDSRCVPEMSSILATSSDACKEGAEHPGMGGYFIGLWWRYIYEPHHLRLDIPVLELLAFGINLIVFEPVFQQMLGEDDILLCFIDAKASPLVLSDGQSRSPVMMFALELIWGLPEYRKLERGLAVAHVYGEGNKPADFASRSNVEALRRYAAQSGLEERELDAPSRARAMLDDVLAFQDKLRGSLQ